MVGSVQDKATRESDRDRLIVRTRYGVVMAARRNWLPRCGAFARSTGLPCRRKPVMTEDGRVRNGRCLNHGGHSTGPRWRDPTHVHVTETNCLMAPKERRGDTDTYFSISTLDTPHVSIFRRGTRIDLTRPPAYQKISTCRYIFFNLKDFFT